LTRTAKGIEGEIELPPGLSGRFIWQGRILPLQPGRQTVSIVSGPPAKE
jgi:hypothetical protein